MFQNSENSALAQSETQPEAKLQLSRVERSGSLAELWIIEIGRL